MPLGRFLKILLGALFALAVVLVVAVQNSGIQPASDIQNFAAYGQIAKEYLNYACTLVTRIIEWFRGLSHDDWLTFSTVLIAIFTFSLWRSTSKLWKASEDQIKLAREEFNAAHRPRIIVRFIQGPLINTEDDFQTAWITIANVGDTTATIFAIGSGLACRSKKSRDWLEPGLDAGAKAIAPFPLESGKPHTFRAVLKSQVIPLAHILGEADICVVGQVLYRDKNNRERETGIFRVYDPISKSFIPSKNSEEEYQD